MDKNEFKIIFEAINEKPIAYHRIYTKITGRVVGGILLSQLVYWAITKNWGEFYKTDKDVADELGVSIK
mgnify:CR=1 FL=1